MNRVSNNILRKTWSTEEDSPAKVLDDLLTSNEDIAEERLEWNKWAIKVLFAFTFSVFVIVALVVRLAHLAPPGNGNLTIDSILMSLGLISGHVIFYVSIVNPFRKRRSRK